METSERTRLMIGEENVNKLAQSRVLVVGTGGVGGMAVESLARSGIGTLILVDQDVVEASNINRQLPALTTTVGQPKVDVLKKRIEEINPDCHVIVFHEFYDAAMNDTLVRLHPDFVLDCIDSLSSKQDLIRWCVNENIPLISSMGMARRQDPACLKIVEVEKTSYDPLAKRLRVWKRKQGIRQKIMTVCSTEIPMEHKAGQPLPSMMFVPAAAGLVMGAACVQQILDRKE